MKLRFSTCIIFLFISPAILLYVTWPWKTAALLILATGVLTITAWVIHRRQQKAIERLRRRIARDLHDDLGASLCNICLLSALVDREIPGEEDAISHLYLNKIIEEATKVHDSIGDTIAVLSAAYENLGDLSALLNRHAYELFRFQKIDFELIIPDQIKLIEISSSHRHDFYLILKEALHNALRHAHATSVTVSFHLNHQKLLCLVTDNGCGFDTRKEQGGHGLKNMKRRAALMGGQLAFESTISGGTTIRLSLPLRSPAQLAVWWHSLKTGLSSNPKKDRALQPEMPGQLVSAYKNYAKV